MDSEKYKRLFYEIIKSRFNREVDFASIEKGLQLMSKSCCRLFK